MLGFKIDTEMITTSLIIPIFIFFFLSHKKYPVTNTQATSPPRIRLHFGSQKDTYCHLYSLFIALLAILTMQLISDETIDHLILEGEEDDEGEGTNFTNRTSITSAKRNMVLDESMTWSLLNEDDAKDISKDDGIRNEDQEEELSQDQRSILPVDSCDSIPSKYDITTENLQQKEEKDTNRSDQAATFVYIQRPNITVSRELEQRRDGIEGKTEHCLKKIKAGFLQLEKVPSWPIRLLFFTTLLFAISKSRQCSIQAREIQNLRKEVSSLQNTISELKTNKTVSETPGWFVQSSALVKEWANSVVDIDLSEFSYQQSSNESTFLDIIPEIIIPDFSPVEAFDAVKNFTNHVTTTISEVFDDVGSNTRDAFSTVGVTVSSLGESISSVETVTEKIQNISLTMYDIFETQKYALLFGAVYFQVYENFFNDMTP